MKEEMVSIDEVIFKRATENAVLVYHGDWEDEVWIPRSTLSIVTDEEIDRLSKDETFKLRVAKWLAIEKGIY